MKILGTGLDGLVGSRIVELLKNGYEFEISDIDITDRHRIFERIESCDASVVLHLAAKTSVDGCEEDRKKDQKLLNRHSGLSRISNQRILESQASPRTVWCRASPDPQNDVYEEWNDKKTAWAVNVIGTRNIADACQRSNKKLIYVSTDFIFDGSKEIYSEEDPPNPINWYAKTKLEGEKIVQDLSTPWVIARLAYPYRASFERMDFFRAILKRLQKGEVVKAVTDHIFTPTFIDDIAFAIDLLIKKGARGIFHVVGSSSLSPYDAAIQIAKAFRLDQSLISKTTRDEFFKGRAKRPFQLALRNDKITRLGVRMRGFEEGLKCIKSQMTNS